MPKLDIANIPLGSLEEAQKYVQDRIQPQDRSQFLGAETPGEVAAAAAAYNAAQEQQDEANGNVPNGTPPGGNNNNDDEDQEQTGADVNVNIFRTFGQNDISEVDKQTITSGLFSGGLAKLTSFSAATASLLGDTSASFIEVHDQAASNAAAQVQFSVGYAHINGSGSIGNTTKTTAGNRETAALYRQFRNVLLAPNDNKFDFTSAPNSSSGHDDFYFITFNRAQMREKVDPGNWELRISGSAAVIGASSSIKLIDDSSATTNTDVNISGRVFNVVSGSIESGTASIKTAASAETAKGAPGLFYPDLGIILLNPDWLMQNAGRNFIPTKGANAFGDNARKIYNSIRDGEYFAARREEEVSSVSYFARARNDQFNFSSNPTYSTGSKVAKSGGGFDVTTGLFKVPSFQGDPRAYITQVGLYDNNNDLLAVAKLSQPVLKSFSREAVVKVKLDY